MIFSRVLPFLACAVSAAYAAFPNPGPVTGNINPVHDPSMVRGPDGTYFLYSTGKGIDVRTSKDRTSFQFAGSVFGDTQPAGTSVYVDASKRGNDLWAPDVHYANGLFRLYYTASCRSLLSLSGSISGT